MRRVDRRYDLFSRGFDPETMCEGLCAWQRSTQGFFRGSY